MIIKTERTSTREENMDFQRQFLPMIKTLILPHVVYIKEPHIEEDLRHNTDLLCLTVVPYKEDGVRVACRIRREEYLKRYGGHFTVRAALPSGVPTEIDKVMGGWGDLFFFGFGSDDGKLLKWTLAKYSVFREWVHAKGGIGGLKRFLVDYSSTENKFYSIPWGRVYPGFVIAQWPPPTLPFGEEDDD